MKKLNKYDRQKLELLERFYWSVQAAVYRAQAAATAEDMSFFHEFGEAVDKLSMAVEKLMEDSGSVLMEQAWAGEAAEKDEN